MENYMDSVSAYVTSIVLITCGRLMVPNEFELLIRYVLKNEYQMIE